MQLTVSKKERISKVSGFQTLLNISGILMILTGSLTLLGWIIKIPTLINFLPRYVPMAATNSLFFILFGLVFVSGEKKLRRKYYRIAILAIIGICSMYGLLQFAGNLITSDLNFDFTLFPVREKVGNFPIGHMSPYAGLLFFISGIAVLLNVFGKNRSMIGNIAAMIGNIVALAGFVAGLGYLFGTPFLYSGYVIPLSLRTAVLFFFTGFGLLFMAGGKTVFLRLVTGLTADARLLRVLIPIIVAVFILNGVLDVVLTQIYKINQAIVLAFLTVFSVILCIIVIVNVTREIFKSANRAETERLKAVEELKKANALQSLILENSTLGICLVHNHIFQWANTHFGEIFQLQSEDLPGYSTSIIFKSDENLENFMKWNKIMDESKIVDMSIQLKRKNDDLYWCRFIGTPLDPIYPDEGYVWLVEDITERRQLRERMRLLSHTIENLAECVSITDTSNRIIFVNKAFEKAYGYKQEELVDKNISIVSSPNNDQEIINSVLPATLKDGWQGEILNRRKDGTEFPVYMSSSKVVNENGEVVALVDVATDITLRWHAEQQLKEYSEELKGSNDAKDKLFSIISHDLRSPFTSIIGFFQLLTEQYDDFTEDEIKSYISSIKETSENTFELLNNLLTWSRTQTGGIKVIQTLIDLPDIVNKQAEILKNAAAKKNISISIQISPGTLAYADIDMVKTILLNLTSNAIKFTRENGTITVTAKVKENEVEVSVADNGVGISRSDLENMFKLDKSRSTSGTSNEKGTGLGLLICKEFIELNKGKIRVESKQGNGSKFIFTLPLFV